MPFDVLGCACATLVKDGRDGTDNSAHEYNRALNVFLQLWTLNSEFQVFASHHEVWNESLPFVHTARRFYQ